MEIFCKLCGNNFRDSPDRVVLCNHYEGVVHLGCCINKCSLDNKPCENSEGIYAKTE